MDLLLDSGAFTAYKQNKPVDFDKYCEFIENPPFALDGYFMLDVIGDPIKTEKNLDRMLTRGLKPIPVFTRGAGLDQLERFYKKCGKVAIGGVAGTTGAKAYVKWLMEKGIKGRQVHWLGFSDRDFILHYRPESVDNSGWGEAGRYGRGKYYFNGRLNVLTRDNWNNTELKTFCVRNDINYSMFKMEKYWRYTRRGGIIASLPQVVTVLSYLMYGYTLEKLVGTKYHFVIKDIGSATDAMHLSRCFESYVLGIDNGWGTIFKL